MCVCVCLVTIKGSICGSILTLFCFFLTKLITLCMWAIEHINGGHGGATLVPPFQCLCGFAFPSAAVSIPQFNTTGLKTATSCEGLLQKMDFVAVLLQVTIIWSCQPAHLSKLLDLVGLAFQNFIQVDDLPNFNSHLRLESIVCGLQREK